MNRREGLLQEVARYYAQKLDEHGATARGVDWNGEDGQVLRFMQLDRIIEGTEPFTIYDLGCGYGALYDFLRERHKDFSYLGIDVSPEMVAAASSRFAGESNARFVEGAAASLEADYGVASGVFNVRQGRSELEWRNYLEATLDAMHATSRRAFAFNCLTSYSDEDRKRDYLYYADPCKLFDFCKRRYSRNVALLHDYELYEFTIIVKKP